MREDIQSILFSQEQLSDRIKELGTKISADFEGKTPLLVGVLKGSFIFMADLVRNITIPCSVEFMALSSYGEKSKTTGAVKMHLDLSVDIEDRHIIIVEDILDSGLTLSYLQNYLNVRNPASISIVTLLDKPGRRSVPVKADYIGFKVPDSFVVGYGLDFAEKYRNLPYIGILKPEVYA